MAGRERVSKQRVSKSESREFAAATAAFCRVTALGAERRGARRLYLSAACRLLARRSVTRTLVLGARSRRRRRLGESTRAAQRACSAAETAERCGRRSRRSSTVGRRLGAARDRPFVLERRWKQARRIASPRTSPSRAAAALARREAVTKAFSSRRCVAGRARVSADRRGRLGDGRLDESALADAARAFLDVAESSSSFAATPGVRDLASELARRAREDAVDARGRVAAVEDGGGFAAASEPDRLWAFR